VRHDSTLKERLGIQRELGEIGDRELGLELLGSGVYEHREVVGIEVVTIDAATQKKLDARYGDGVVEVTAQLHPID
jgi:hypothetical protein